MTRRHPPSCPYRAARGANARARWRRPTPAGCLAAMGARGRHARATRQGRRCAQAPPLLEAAERQARCSPIWPSASAALVCDPLTPEGQAAAAARAGRAPTSSSTTRRCVERQPRASIRNRHRQTLSSLVHVSVLPFGASGPKAHWDGEELNLLHAGGEGFLLPNGLSLELFPDRPPLKIYGHFAGYQGGSIGGALRALAALVGGARGWRPVRRRVGAGRDARRSAPSRCSAWATARSNTVPRRSLPLRRRVLRRSTAICELLTLEDRQWECARRAARPTRPGRCEEALRGSARNAAAAGTRSMATSANGWRRQSG